ncbi:MAG TPA: thioredoxin family protein [Thermoplasmata archaeon]|nr:thioredoxin family protein [Thermoplasmata archaeon]
MDSLSEDQFEAQTLRRPGRYAVVFSADWCPFCRAFLPPFASLAGPPGFHLARVDLTDLENPLWEQFEIEVVPTVVVFRDGEVTLRIDGVAGVGLGTRDVDRVRAALTS